MNRKKRFKKLKTKSKLPKKNLKSLNKCKCQSSCLNSPSSLSLFREQRRTFLKKRAKSPTRKVLSKNRDYLLLKKPRCLVQVFITKQKNKLAQTLNNQLKNSQK